MGAIALLLIFPGINWKMGEVLLWTAPLQITGKRLTTRNKGCQSQIPLEPACLGKVATQHDRPYIRYIHPLELYYSNED
jgi:hypothetical protein